MSLPDLWALTLMTGGGLFAWWLAQRMAEPEDRRFLTRIVAISFVLRAGWSVFQHVIYPPVWRMFAADAIARFSWGLRDAQRWHEGTWSPVMPASLAETHSALIHLQTTVLIYIFGPSPMLSEALTITLNVTTVIAAYLICRHIGGTRAAARTTVLLVAFMPSLIFWSTQNLKDPVTATCIAWALLALLKVGSQAHGGYLLLLLGANFVAIVYRPYVGILLAVGQALAWALTVKLPKNTLGSATRIAMFSAISPLAVYIGIQEMQETYGEEIGLEWAVQQYTVFREAGIAEGGRGSAYEIPITATSPRQALFQLPVRVLLLMLTPIPIFPGALSRMMTYPEMWFLYLFVVPWFATGCREAWRKNRVALVTLLLVLAPLVVSYSLKTAVSGEAIRMRSQFVPVLLIFAGVGHAVRKRRRQKRKRTVVAHSPVDRYVEAQKAAAATTDDDTAVRRDDTG